MVARCWKGIGAVVLVLLAASQAGATGSSIDLDRRSGAGPVVPFWDDVALRRCQMDCSWHHILDQEDYNECYACRCLPDAAEDEGELRSARAQCAAERPRPTWLGTWRPPGGAGFGR